MNGARVHATGAVLRLAWRSVMRRPLSSILTVLAVALGVALVVVVDTIRTSADTSFRETARGYDLILGPRHGSPLQVVLSTLFHIDEPPGTVPWHVYETAREDPRVAAAIPYAMGDTYRGRRVIGTSSMLFHVLTDGAGRSLSDGARGRIFEPERFEAVVGSVVARSTGLALGSSFRVSHGLVESPHLHEESWTVVGVLRPTGTPHDRAIYIPIETFFAIPGHEATPGDVHDDEHDEEHGDEHEGPGHALSAVALRLKQPGLRLAYVQELRAGHTEAQAILPADEVRKLLAIVGDVNRGVTLVAWLVTLVAAISILVGLYNTIHGRRREIAVVRALGARPRHVFALILLEALILCFAGGLLGLLLGHGAASAAAPVLLESYGIRVQVGFGTHDLQVLAVLGILGLAAGLLPAWRGLATPVADNLHAND